MINTCRLDLKLLPHACFVVLVGLGAWLALALLAELAQMKAVTAQDPDSLGGAAALAAARAQADYPAACLWVWFCIGAYAAVAVLLGLWLKAALAPEAQPGTPGTPGTLGTLGEPRGPGASAPVASVAPGASSAAPAPSQARADSLVTRAMERAGQDRDAPAQASPAPLRAPETPDARAAAGDASARVVRVIRIIDELAFRTTVLAVNAAFEAARQGRQGRSP